MKIFQARSSHPGAPVHFFFWLAIFLFSTSVSVYFCAVIIWYSVRYKTLRATVPPPCLHYCTNVLLCFPAVQMS